MTAPLNYDKISMQDKFIMMEELWENMSQTPQDKGFTPDWHLEVLASREESLTNESFSDFESAKERLHKLVR